MAGKYLLDTNIVGPIISGDRALGLRLTRDTEVSVPIIVVGELAYGAMCSQRQVENLTRLRSHLSQWPVLVLDDATAHHYGTIKAQLRARGRPIPDNDLWIAALALQHGLTLVSRDAHFTEVEGLALEAW